MARHWDGDDLAPARRGRGVRPLCGAGERAVRPGLRLPGLPRAPGRAQARAEGDHPLGRMVRRGSPLTKAFWLFEATQGEPPEFPLHPDLEAQIPRALWGPVPQTLDDYLELLPNERGPSFRWTRNCSRRDRTSLRGFQKPSFCFQRRPHAT